MASCCCNFLVAVRLSSLAAAGISHAVVPEVSLSQSHPSPETRRWLSSRTQHFAILLLLHIDLYLPQHLVDLVSLPLQCRIVLIRGSLPGAEPPNHMEPLWKRGRDPTIRDVELLLSWVMLNASIGAWKIDRQASVWACQDSQATMI